MRRLLVTLATLTLFAQEARATSLPVASNPDPWMASNLKAESAYRRGDLNAAIVTLQKSIGESRKDTTGLRQLITMRNLAQVYEAGGQYQAAEKAYLLLLSEEQKRQGSDPLLLVPRLQDLARFYSTRAQSEPAARYLERILQIKSEFYGKNSPALSEYRLELISIYRNLGDTKLESAQIDKLLSDLAATKEAQTPTVIKALTQLCIVYGNKELPKQAQPLVAKAIERLKSQMQHSTDSDERITLLSQIVTFTALLHQPLENEYKELLAAFDSNDAKADQTRTRSSYRRVARALTQAGEQFSRRAEFEKSLACYQRASKAAALAQDKSLSQDCAKDSAFVLLYLGRTTEAVAVCHQYNLPVALTLQNAADHLYYLTPNFLSDHHNHLVGEQIAKAALRYGKQEDLSALELTKLEQSLAQFYHVQKRDKEAESLCRHGIKLEEENMGTNSHGLVGMLVFLSYTLVGQGKSPEARTALRRAWRIYRMQNSKDQSQLTYLKASWEFTDPPAGSSIQSDAAEGNAK